MSVPSSAFRIVTVFQNCFKGKICSGESLKTVSRTVSGPPIVPGTNQWFPLYFPLNQSSGFKVVSGLSMVYGRDSISIVFMGFINQQT